MAGEVQHDDCADIARLLDETGPNLLLWTGSEHRLVLALKDDVKETAWEMRHGES